METRDGNNTVDKDALIVFLHAQLAEQKIANEKLQAQLASLQNSLDAMREQQNLLMQQITLQQQQLAKQQQLTQQQQPKGSAGEPQTSKKRKRQVASPDEKTPTNTDEDAIESDTTTAMLTETDNTSTTTTSDDTDSDTTDKSWKQVQRKTKKTTKTPNNKKGEAFPPLAPPKKTSPGRQIPVAIPGPSGVQHKTSNTNNTSTKPTAPAPIPKQKPQTPEKQGTVPVILRQPEKWMQIQRELTSRNIHFIAAKKVHLGIHITPETTADHRKMTKFFTESKIQYHTYLLPEEKLLNIIIRGLDVVSAQDVKEDLEEKGFHPVECFFLRQTHNGANKLIKVLLPKEEKEIYNLEFICRLRCKIEAQKPRNGVAQCHNCQQFGHAASNCHAQPRCVKCEGLHHFSECVKKTEEKPVCTNCGGEHPASYGGCPRNPTNVRKTFAQIAKAAPATHPQIPTPKPAPIPKPSNVHTSSMQMEQFFVSMQSHMQTMMQDMMAKMVQSMFSAQSTIQSLASSQINGRH